MLEWDFGGVLVLWGRGLYYPDVELYDADGKLYHPGGTVRPLGANWHTLTVNCTTRSGNSYTPGRLYDPRRELTHPDGKLYDADGKLLHPGETISPTASFPEE